MKHVKLEEQGYRLVVADLDPYVWGLGWEQLEGEYSGCVDAWLGENRKPVDFLENLAFRLMKDRKVPRDQRGCFFFESEKEAKLALAAVRVAVASGGKPWPEWALKAKEAGWKAPRGWQP